MESSEQTSLKQSSANHAPEFDIEFPAALDETEMTLTQIRTRYLEIQTAQAEKAQLEKTLSHLETDIAQQTELKQSIAELETELIQVQEQIHNLGVTLESQLWKWHDLKEPFWKFIRHFGLGFAFAFALQKLTA